MHGVCFRNYCFADELISQTDAKSQTTTLAYDLLGRLTSRVDPSGFTSTWTWGTSAANHNIGALASLTTSGSGSGSSRSQTYDSLGRPYQTFIVADTSNCTAAAPCVYTDSFDSDGRLSSVAYPSGFTAAYEYTSLGYLSKIHDTNLSGAVLWTVNARDAELHLKQATLGNGVVVNNAFDADTGLMTGTTAGSSNAIANLAYTWDTIGNLTKRTDGVTGGYSESFCYDTLNRLVHSKLASSINCTSDTYATSVAYSAIGNITSKTQIGSSSANTYSYPSSGSSSVRPHAVSSITGSVNGASNPSFSYDSNGNLLSGANRTVTWTSFNMAASIVQGSDTIAYTYDGEHARIKQTDPAGTTYYLGDPASGSVEEKYVSGSTTTWKTYLMADSALVAQRTCTGAAPCTSGATWNYFIADHLGSTAIVLDASGTVTQRLAYDAWGRMRNSNGSDDTAGSLPDAADTSRQFTGQEHIPDVGLLNYNARIYDPEIGRMMSADPTVPDPFASQSFNRFSYVNNGPLSATDPSGYCAGSHISNADGSCALGGPFLYSIGFPDYNHQFGSAAVLLPVFFPYEGMEDEFGSPIPMPAITKDDSTANTTGNPSDQPAQQIVVTATPSPRFATPPTITGDPISPSIQQMVVIGRYIPGFAHPPTLSGDPETNGAGNQFSAINYLADYKTNDDTFGSIFEGCFRNGRQCDWVGLKGRDNQVYGNQITVNLDPSKKYNVAIAGRDDGSVAENIFAAPSPGCKNLCVSAEITINMSDGTVRKTSSELNYGYGPGATQFKPIDVPAGATNVTVSLSNWSTVPATVGIVASPVNSPPSM